MVKGESGSILRVLGYIRHTGAQQFHATSRKHSNDSLVRANPDSLSLSAWPKGEDTVKVIGSKAQLSKLTYSVSGSSVSSQKPECPAESNEHVLLENGCLCGIL